MTSESAVRIVQLYPRLLGTYGDSGNATVLRQRAAWRNIPCEVRAIDPGQAVPRSADIYLVGGGEDAKQTAAAHELRVGGALGAAVDHGATVLGICAGYQLLGNTFLGVGGVVTPGLELIDATTTRRQTRAVGNVQAACPFAIELPDLIGFENHGGATTLGSAAQPLAAVRIGVGNGDGTGTEGAVQGRVYGTYLHGPVLALNPALADRLLSHAVGDLAPLDDQLIEEFRRHRIDVVLPGAQRSGMWQKITGLFGKSSARSGASASLSGS